VSKRLAPTLADYAVIAFSPAMIMTLVGSLIFFLIEVFYLGEYDGRLNFIMAMFVMGAVLIARIAIEEGRDYALMFAVPLGIVTAIATFRFVEFSGPLKGISPIINLGLIGLIWWCANKLTWDSTVIDEGKDASGEGLLQTVGLDSNESATDSKSIDRDGTTGRIPEPQLTWWQKFVKRRHRPHAPGVWVIYFSLAALPIFGFGNWFIPSSDPDSRRYVFKLLIVYVASALGLLLATSFLGLRRYLRQRRLEMPTEIAAAWMGTGGLMIVGLLAFCLILPRRNAEYSITQLPFFAGSPSDLWTTEYAVGNEGQVDPENADRDGEQSGGEGSSDNSDQNKRSDKSAQGKSESGQSQDSQSGGQQDGGQQSGGQQGGQQDGGQRESDQSQGKQGQGQEDSGKQSDDGSSSQSSSNQQPQDNSPEDQQNKNKQKSDSKSGQNQKSKSPSSNADQKDNEQQNTSSSQANDQKPENKASERKSPSRSSSRQQAKSSPQPKSRFDPSKIGSAIGGTFGKLMKFIYWLIVFLIVGYVVWRYHREIIAAVQNFLKSIREFWESLFGRKGAAAEEIAAAAAEPVGPPKPFSSFADPFLTGMAQQRPPAEVIRYSFEAFEAWGRERGYPRGPEQTPHEYALLMGQQQSSLGRDASALADLYCRCAYSKDPTNRTNFEHLRRLWEKLRASPVV
jgi:hypothetical protein